MAPAKIKGVKSFRSKGRLYHYHRATNVPLKAEYGSAAFLLEVAALDKKVQPKPDAGSLGRLIDAYKLSSLWADLSPATRTSYDRAFTAMGQAVRSRPIKEFTPPFIAKIRDLVLQKHKRWMANYVLTVLVILFDLAREQGSVDDNPAKGVRRVKKDRSAPTANRPWTAGECRAVLDAAPRQLVVPIALAMFAGFRKSDVLTIGPQALSTKQVLQNGKPVDVRFISHRTSKRRVDVDFPVHQELANALALAPKHKAKTLAANSRGETWTESGFNSSFGKLIKQLENEGRVGSGLTMHGLRHTVGTRLFEAGADLEDIKRLLGQQSTAMAQHYSRTADISERATRLVGRMKVIGE